MLYSQDPHPQVGDPPAIITIAEVLSKEWVVQAPHQAPWPKGPAPGKWALRTFGFEDQQGLFSEEPEGCGK